MEIGKFNLIKTEGRARRGEFCTAHGVVQTPVFQNVGTAGAIKGAVDAFDLKELGCQIELSNTYHLHVRPGDQIVKQMGGLHKFMRWDGPMLTDSGGFQVFSLATLRKIKEEGVTFHSHVDGRKISWDRRRACASSPTLAQILRWRSTSVSRIRRRVSMLKTPLTVPRAGSNAVKPSLTV